MEGRIQRFLLTAAAAAALWAGAGQAGAGTRADDLELETLAVREPERRAVDVDAIDSENWEVAVHGGLMSVEDFGTNAVAGLRVAYHVTEDLFVEGSYGRTRLGKTSFERLSGGALLLTDAERRVSYYNVAVGYNLFPGEAFLASRWAFRGGLFLLAGAGSTRFGGDDHFTVNAGFGYRLIPVDWMALRLDVRDHVFESDLLGTRQTRHNIEFSAGLTLFF